MFVVGLLNNFHLLAVFYDYNELCIVCYSSVDYSLSLATGGSFKSSNVHQATHLNLVEEHTRLVPSIKVMVYMPIHHMEQGQETAFLLSIEWSF